SLASRPIGPPSARDSRVEPPDLRPAPPRPSEAPPTPVVPSDISRERVAASRAAAPSTKHRGRLIVIAKDGGEGQSYPIDERLDIGRTEGDVLVTDDGYLSPRHARLSWRNGLFLRDLGSTNGVYLRLAANSKQAGDRNAAAPNGPAAQTGSIAKKLEDQDLILLGQQVIRFEVVKDAEEGLGPASQHGTLVFGTPVAPRYARLCLRTVEGVTRDVYYLGKRETILGRESGDIIFAEDPFLSRRHAAIRVHDAEAGAKKRSFSLSDFGSSNGTFVQIRGESPLENGDEFRVGQQLFRVELGT
ncbi:MAG: FHA domain-containing protein, partial [Polyangiaceae bacterium]